MKTYKVVNSCLLVLLVVLFFSCDNKDPLPISKVGFEVINKDNLERFIPVKFVNLSTNAATYKWDFGDGTSDSLIIAPEHIYTEEGSYDVTLTATTEDGQQTTEIISIDIKTRVLIAFSVANISFVDGDGNPWDDDSGPDLVFAFGEQTAELEEWIITDTIVDVTPADFPITWTFSEGNGLELNDVLHDLILLDADPENVDTDPFQVMFGIEMNPVQYEFMVKDDDDNGLLQVSIDGFAIDFFLTFALQ